MIKNDWTPMITCHLHALADLSTKFIKQLKPLIYLTFQLKNRPQKKDKIIDSREEKFIYRKRSVKYESKLSNNHHRND